MRKLLLIAILFSFSTKIFSQFEGEILYKIVIKNEALDKLSKDKTYTELKKANSFYDTLTVFIKNNNFITVKNDNFETKTILIEKEKKEFTISKIIFPKNGKRLLTTIDLENNPMYNKDNFENYEGTIVSDTVINSKSCKKYVLNDSKISEVFIICDDSPKTQIDKNYLISPYIGQNLNSPHYKPFKNKIIYYYEMSWSGIKYVMQLIKIDEKQIDDNKFIIPKSNNKGIINE